MKLVQTSILALCLIFISLVLAEEDGSRFVFYGMNDDQCRGDPVDAEEGNNDLCINMKAPGETAQSYGFLRDVDGESFEFLIFSEPGCSNGTSTSTKFKYNDDAGEPACHLWSGEIKGTAVEGVVGTPPVGGGGIIIVIIIIIIVLGAGGAGAWFFMQKQKK